MTEAVVENQQEDTSEADFAKGFSEARVEAPAPAAEIAKPQEEAKTEVVVPEEKPVEQKPSGPIVFQSMDEFNAAVEKSAKVAKLEEENRRNFSQYGELKRALSEMSQKLATGGTPTARKQITAAMLKRVNEELPGLGDALAQDLSDVLGGAEAAQAKAESQGKAFDPDAYFAEKLNPAFQALETRIKEQEQRAELRIVKRLHPDFDKVVKSSEFGEWLKTLPEAKQKEMRESEDGDVAADAVTEFKTYTDKQKKAKEKTNKRLESAVAPQGAAKPDGPVQQDEEAAFTSGYQTAGKKYASR